MSQSYITLQNILIYTKLQFQNISFMAVLLSQVLILGSITFGQGSVVTGYKT